MKIIHPEQLKQYLNQELNSCYIFLGEDYLLINKNQDLILKFSKKKGFIEKISINIEKNTDWKKVIHFYKKKHLFFNKTILIINFIIQKLDTILINNIEQMFVYLNLDILVIFKFNKLSRLIKKNQLLNKLISSGKVINCFTPYYLSFINWIKYEIKEKKINIEYQALCFLYKYYEGHTLFAYKILEILSITWPKELITIKKIKKIITNFSIFSPSHWINAIFTNQKKKLFIF